MKIEDALGAGKVLPIDKLIDLINKCLGKVTKSYFDRKEVRTKAYEIEKLAEARVKEINLISKAIQDNSTSIDSINFEQNQVTIKSSKDIREVKDLSLEERTSLRDNFQQAKRQINIESVTGIATEELAESGKVSNEPVDVDWGTRFFKHVEDVSSEELQLLWGKILAGEIKRPKSYSLRTLDLVKNLSKNEAELISKIARYAVYDDQDPFVFREKNDMFHKRYEMKYDEITKLMEIGILKTNEFIDLVFEQDDDSGEWAFRAGSETFNFWAKGRKTFSFSFRIYGFTTMGQELLKLIVAEPDNNYLEDFKSELISAGLHLKTSNKR